MNDRAIVWIGWVMSVVLALCWGFDHRANRRENAALLAAIQTLDAAHPAERPVPVTQPTVLPAREDSEPREWKASAVTIPEPEIEAPLEMPSAAQPEMRAWVEGFDRAMDREFQRLEARERQTEDEAELAVLGEIKEALEGLDDIWRRLDEVDPASEERVELVQQAQEAMGSVIRLAATDRNLCLSRVAHSLGLEEEHEITLFISELDQIFRETNLDWSKLFIRGF